MEVKGAVFVCYPKLPLPQCNHVADIDINDNEVEDLLDKATGHFHSRGSSSIRFRITPLTRPRAFSSFLEGHGFEKKSEESVMVFKGGRLEDKLNPDVKVSARANP